MKRRLWSVLLVCLTLLALAGCGEKAQSPESPQGTDAPVSTQTQPDAAPQAPQAPERPAVEGNGGQFVRVGGQVWFRRYDDGAIDETALWGEFLSMRYTHAVSSMLCYYDEASGTVTEAMRDDGFGELWFGVDGFYLTRDGDDGLCHAYFRAMDGTVTELCIGEVFGVSDNGRFAAVLTWGPPEDGAGMRVYEGTKEIRTIPILDDGPNPFAVCDDGAVVYRDYNKVCKLDAEDETLVLGTLPEPDADYELWWEFEQCLLDGNDVWCTFGAYEGTGHFLSDVLCVRARLDTENSLEVIEDQPTTEYPFVPKLWRDESGAVQRTEYAPGELEIAYESGGLCWYETADEETALIASFLPQSGYSDDRWIEQGMEALSDAAYVIVAQAYCDEENDVGWRMAYRPGELRYLRVPLRAGAAAEPLDGKAWEAAPAAAEVYAGFAGTWTLFATEVEGDRSDTLPDGTFEYLEFRADGTAVIGGTEYENEFPSMELLPTNGEGEGMSAYGLLFTGGANDDMLWAYFEGDTLVGTVMVHFEVDGGVDAYSRTGFYERSAG